MEETALQMLLLFALTFTAGMVVGGAIVSRHFRHRDEVKEAREAGRREERTRKAPPTEYEKLLRLLNELCLIGYVTDYEVKTDDGETFTYTNETKED